MKKNMVFTFLALLTVLSMGLSACTGKETSDSQPDTTAAVSTNDSSGETQSQNSTDTTDISNTSKEAPDMTETSGYQRITYNSHLNLAALITSADQLGNYSLDSREEWNDDFFAHYQLILVGYNTNSGSIHPSISKVEKKDATYQVTVTCSIPNSDAVTTDMASYLVWKVVPKDDTVTAVKLVNPSAYGKPAVDK